jgi:hypothetical protein
MAIPSKTDNTVEAKKFPILRNTNLTTIIMQTKEFLFKMANIQKMRKQAQKISLSKCRLLKIITSSGMKQTAISL